MISTIVAELRPFYGFRGSRLSLSAGHRCVDVADDILDD